MNNNIPDLGQLNKQMVECPVKDCKLEFPRMLTGDQALTVIMHQQLHIMEALDILKDGAFEANI